MNDRLAALAVEADALAEADPPSYDSAHRPAPAVEELRLLWRHRELVIQLIRRDVVARYKRSVLGVLWTVLNPLGTITWERRNPVRPSASRLITTPETIWLIWNVTVSAYVPSDVA